MVIRLESLLVYNIIDIIKFKFNTSAMGVTVIVTYSTSINILVKYGTNWLPFYLLLFFSLYLLPNYYHTSLKKLFFL